MKACVIGYGHAGRRHIGNLRDLGIKEISVVDPKLEAARMAHDDLELEVIKLKNLGEEGADIWLICTPPQVHLYYLWMGLIYGKHVFVEKPLSDTLDGVTEVRGTMARKKECVVMVGHNLRFNRNLQYLKGRIRKGEKIEHARAEFSHDLRLWHPDEDYRRSYIMDCGFLIDSAVHEIDYLRWLFGEIKAVRCKTDHITDLAIDVDCFDLMLKFENMIADVHMDLKGQHYKRDLTVKLADKCHTVTYPLTPDNIAPTYHAEMRHFLNCIKSGRKPMVTFEDGVGAVEVALAAQLSAEMGGKEIGV